MQYNDSFNKLQQVKVLSFFFGCQCIVLFVQYRWFQEFKSGPSLQHEARKGRPVTSVVAENIGVDR